MKTRVINQGLDKFSAEKSKKCFSQPFFWVVQEFKPPKFFLVSPVGAHCQDCLEKFNHNTNITHPYNTNNDSTLYNTTTTFWFLTRHNSTNNFWLDRRQHLYILEPNHLLFILKLLQTSWSPIISTRLCFVY